VLHLLLAHHAADQAETLAMRMLRGSHAEGLAGMAALAETQRVRILRPLLGTPPIRLRQTLIAAGIDWIEDPSNRDPAAQRSRLRALRRDADGTGPATMAAVATTRLRGTARLAAERARAEWLGRHVTLHPEGYAELDALPEDPAALAAVLRVVAGAPRPPPLAAVRRFLDRGGPGTLGGVLIRPARGGWLLVRETAAIRDGDELSPGSLWDGRFRLLAGAAADRGALPALVRRALPAGHAVLWSPRLPLAGAGFVVTPM
jgi:tRNA(Ile)-lysidine synthase